MYAILRINRKIFSWAKEAKIQMFVFAKLSAVCNCIFINDTNCKLFFAENWHGCQPAYDRVRRREDWVRRAAENPPTLSRWGIFRSTSLMIQVLKQLNTVQCMYRKINDQRASHLGPYYITALIGLNLETILLYIQAKINLGWPAARDLSLSYPCCDWSVFINSYPNRCRLL